jgi:hypothetical protein
LAPEAAPAIRSIVLVYGLSTGTSLTRAEALATLRDGVTQRQCHGERSVGAQRCQLAGPPYARLRDRHLARPGTGRRVFRRLASLAAIGAVRLCVILRDQRTLTRPASGCRVPPIACSSHQISMVAAAITTPVTNAAKQENSRRSFSTPVMAASPMRASHVGVSSPEGSSALLYRGGKVMVRSANWFAFPANDFAGLRLIQLTPRASKYLRGWSSSQKVPSSQYQTWPE